MKPSNTGRLATAQLRDIIDMDIKTVRDAADWFLTVREMVRRNGVYRGRCDERNSLRIQRSQLLAIAELIGGYPLAASLREYGGSTNNDGMVLITEGFCTVCYRSEPLSSIVPLTPADQGPVLAKMRRRGDAAAVDNFHAESRQPAGRSGGRRDHNGIPRL